MKNNILYLCFIFGFVACTTPFQSFGEFSRDQLENSTHNNWFLENYNAHPLNKALVSQIHSLFDDIEVTIYMGTWCEDSQREVPGMLKILDALGMKNSDIIMYATDEDKKTPDQYELGLDITNIPTLIFYKGEEELNRIVELPVETLYKDFAAILTNKPYQHAYFIEVETP